MTEPTSLKARVEKLEADLGLMSWLYAELIHGLRMAMVQQMLQSPEVQQHLQNELLQRLTGPPRV